MLGPANFLNIKHSDIARGDQVWEDVTRRGDWGAPTQVHILQQLRTMFLSKNLNNCPIRGRLSNSRFQQDQLNTYRSLPTPLYKRTAVPVVNALFFLRIVQILAFTHQQFLLVDYRVLFCSWNPR